MSTYLEMKTELAARGFNDLSVARRGALINQARAELDGLYLWPWREAAGTGLAPVDVTDLGVIEAVTNETDQVVLEPAQYRWLVAVHGADLDETADPIYYYVAWPNGTPAVATYPNSSKTIGIQYWKITADLSADGDEPASPADAHPVIVDIAVRRAYRDRHNHAEAREMQVEIDTQIDRLLLQYPPGAADGAGHVVIPSRS